MFTYMGQNHVEMSSTTMSPPAAFIGEHQQQEELFMEMETTTRAQEIKKNSCCSSSINTIVAAAAAAEVQNPNSSSVVGAGSDSCNTKKPKTPRKRSGKMDRHSKIFTAQGTRGRRMRLSLDIASRFFSLQDMLGFDKASKTVGWLLSKSKHAIKDLCLPDDNYEDEDEGKPLEDMMATKRAKKKKKITVGTCKVMTSPMNQGQGLVVDREELRVMARARARERTLDKLKVPKSNQFTNNKGSSHSMGSASSFEIEYEQCPGSTNQINKSADQEDNINNNSIPANFTQNWAIDHVTTIPFPSSTYGAVMHQHLSTTAGDIHEQAVPRSIFTTSSDLRLQSHFSDSQLYGKLWEHYYTYSNLR